MGTCLQKGSRQDGHVFAASMGTGLHSIKFKAECQYTDSILKAVSSEIDCNYLRCVKWNIYSF